MARQIAKDSKSPKSDDEHKLFCEMDVLFENMEWREAARWLKFEETVENGGRWSKPHVATLSLRSLFELSNSIKKALVLLDFHCSDANDLIDKLVDEAIRFEYIDVEKKETLSNVLKLKHVHQHEKEYQKQLDTGSRINFPIVKSFSDLKRIATHTSSLNETQPSIVKGLTISSTKLSKSESKTKINQHFMKKISEGAETSNILVGEVDFLESQFTAFVRLNQSLLLGDFTEVSVPTRFLVVILGPKSRPNQYYDIGRAISTLLSDEIFQESAYKFEDKQDILKAIEVFVDQLIVLPPGEWDESIRLTPPEHVQQKESRLKTLAKLNDSLTNSSLEEKNQIQAAGSSFDSQPYDEEAIKNKELGLYDEYAEYETDPTLMFTGRICGGLIDDLKRKIPFYPSDFKDGLNFQCLSSVMFMYFACLAPIITFGGLLGTATDLNMSAFESLLAGSFVGVLYSLFSGQPLAILGSTGPVLVFETILNIFCKEYGIDYMGFRAFIGLWTMLVLFIIVITDASALVKYITRFTEESFAALIAFIFIKESILKLRDVGQEYPYSSDPELYGLKSNCCSIENMTDKLLLANTTECSHDKKICDYAPDIYFFSVILFMFTYLLATAFRWFRTSSIFPSKIRRVISDFGVIITIGFMVFIDSWFNLDTPKLIVPLKFQTTNPDRGWLINPFERLKAHLWLALIALVPALLLTILVFMDQHITVLIVNRKENKFKKSYGYHLDLLIVAICIGVNSVLGLPWFVAATVLSINHVISLKQESHSTAPGEKPKFLGVIEQRVTSLIVFISIGLSTFLASWLRKIPMPVLYGIFLYMGLSTLNGMEFVNRIILLFTPEKHQPDYMFLRYVRTFKVHIFTMIQILCIILLFVIKSSKTISITFPLMIVALLAVRKIMELFFSQKELFYLDDLIKTKANSSGANKRNKDKSETYFIKDGVKVKPPEIVVFDIDGSNMNVEEVGRE